MSHRYGVPYGNIAFKGFVSAILRSIPIVCTFATISSILNEACNVLMLVQHIAGR